MKGDIEYLRVLLPSKPKDDLADVSRLVEALLPRGRTYLRRLYVYRPLEADVYIPNTYARVPEIAQLEFDAENATRYECEREIQPLAREGFEVCAEVVRGMPVEEVLREASLWRADLVAVRTRRANARDDRIGGMTSGLLHHGTCPILTYREVPAGYSVRRVLIPVDFSAASRLALEWGLAVAEATGAEAHLLHVVTRRASLHGLDQADLIDMASEELARWRNQGSSLFARPVAEVHVASAPTPAEGIFSFAAEGRFDLIVLSGAGISAVRSILLGSNARKVVRSSWLPVMVIPSSNRVTAESFLHKARGFGARKGLSDWIRVSEGVDEVGVAR